jgi:hypothetical protein
MNQGSLLTTALCLSESDAEALITGRSIAALSRTFTNAISTFAICSVGESSLITAWATLDSCRVYTDSKDSESLAWNTIWSMQFLHSLLEEKHRIFLNVLRVYQLPQPVRLPENKGLDTIGGFIKLRTAISYTSTQAVLSDHTFSQRKNHLDNRELPLHLDLQKLQHQISQISHTNPAAKAFDQTLQVFLGWGTSRDIALQIEPWVKEITLSGNSSDGDLFEKRVRQAFIHLGFTNTLNDPKKSLDPEASGGAGGIDFYCEAPYPIVGECKASKSLKVNDNKDGAPFQLIKLGQKYLQQEGFNSAIKIIMAPGKLTKDANLTAIGNQMNIMRPETLQRLIEIKTAHPGAIDLLKLKPCLRNAPFGTDADTKINEFIDGILQEIRIRAHAVGTFKTYLEKTKVSEAGIEKFSGFFCGSDAPQHLEDRELYDILIELSSPLAGYLGRIKGDNLKGDRFYFLRELQID